MPDSISDLALAELGVGTRAVNALSKAGINTVSDALTALEGGDEVLTSIKGFGPKSLSALKAGLLERGYSLPGEPAAPPAQVASALEEEAALAAALFAEETVLEEEAEPVAPAAVEPVAPVTVGPVAPAAVEPIAPVVPAEPEPEVEPVAPVQHVAPKPEPAEKPLSLGERLRATFAHVRGQPGSGAWAYGVIGLLLIVALLLPPISLLQRLGITGYTTLSAENNTTFHPDGLTLSVDPETFSGKLRVRLGSVPREDLLMGDAGSALKKAIAALPGYLEVKSPLYQIQARGHPDQPVTIDVVMPNNAEPWETLDLYTWTGESWEWVGSELHTEMAEHEHISARVTNVPDNLVVVQAKPLTSTIVSTFLEPGDDLASAGALDEIHPTGLLLGVDGGFVGDPAGLLQPVNGAAYAVLPALRNWAPNAIVNQGLLSDLLQSSEAQKVHVANIVQLCQDNGFAGVDVDYRGVSPQDREAFSDFIATLAQALHAEGLRLTVTLEPPTASDGGWDGGGYDWRAIGGAADAVQAPFPADPAAYVADGEAQQLLDWATAQVSRYKLRMLVPSLSAEWDGVETRYVSLEQALAPFGEVMALDDVEHVESGSQVKFGFSGQVLGITPLEESGTYRLEYESDDGGRRSVWLGTATSLATKLNWARRYHLGGVAVSGILAPGNADGIADAVASYRAGLAAPAGPGMDVSWTISSAAAVIDQQVSSLTEPDYVWTALVPTGTYTIAATVAGFSHGSVEASVGAAEPEVAQVVTPTTKLADSEPTAAAGGASEPTAADECLNAGYVADVTVPDNEHFDNGATFVKTWRVRNTGTCAWPEGTVLAFAEGEQMGAPESVPVGALEPGAEVDVSVDMVAPAEANVYTGIWRMKTGDGFFGGNLSVVIQAGEVAATASVTPISGGSFELGGHIRDGSFPYADKMHYAGMTWAKVQVHYGEDATGIIAAAHGRGFKIQLSALGSPGLVTQPGFEQNFANWVASLAAEGADAIEVWNEPNIDREWQIGSISPQAYTSLLCTAYSAIKGANAGTAVISAAPAPTGFFGGCGPNGCDDQPWLEGMYNAGAANCMNYIGAHHNSGATSPSAGTGHPADGGAHHHSWYFLPQTRLYYNIFGGARKIFYTEMGYASQEGLAPFSDAFAWARGINNAQQAAWLAEAVQLSSNTGMVRCIIVWNIDFVRYGYDPQDGYAIIRPGGGCPACDSLHAVLGTR